MRAVLLAICTLHFGELLNAMLWHCGMPWSRRCLDNYDLRNTKAMIIISRQCPDAAGRMTQTVIVNAERLLRFYYHIIPFWCECERFVFMLGYIVRVSCMRGLRRALMKSFDGRALKYTYILNNKINNNWATQ